MDKESGMKCARMRSKSQQNLFVCALQNEVKTSVATTASDTVCYVIFFWKLSICKQRMSSFKLWIRKKGEEKQFDVKLKKKCEKYQRK